MFYTVENMFERVVGSILSALVQEKFLNIFLHFSSEKKILISNLINEPRSEKTGLWGFQPGPTKITL